jgi:hypothetical protein
MTTTTLTKVNHLLKSVPDDLAGDIVSYIDQLVRSYHVPNEVQKMVQKRLDNALKNPESLISLDDFLKELDS